MAGFTVSNATQIQGGAPGVAMIGPNTRVRGQQGFLGTAADALTFSNGRQGSWLVPNQRMRVQGAFVVSQSSQGIAPPPPPPPGPFPVVVVTPDTRIRSL